MKRKYINQGVAGTSHSVMLVMAKNTKSNEQGVQVQVGKDHEVASGLSMILDAEQVADLIAHLQQICPCAVKQSVAKIVDVVE